jgi:hypothetical protein
MERDGDGDGDGDKDGEGESAPYEKKCEGAEAYIIWGKGWGQLVGCPDGPDSDRSKAQKECEMDLMRSAGLACPPGLTVLPSRPAGLK